MGIDIREHGGIFGGGSSGKKWAMGTSMSSGNQITVRGLKFKPTLVIGVYSTPSGNKYNQYTSTMIDNTIFGGAGVSFVNTGNQNLQYTWGSFASDGFTLGVAASTYQWLAFE